MSTNSFLGNQLLVPSNVYQEIAAPGAFTWTPSFTVYKNIVDNSFSVLNWDITSYAPTGKTYYVSKTGNDGWDGLTPATALRNVKTGVAKADVDVLIIGPGVFSRVDGWAGVAATRSIAVYGESDGSTILTNHQSGLSWALDGVLTNTWKTTRSFVGRVLDVSQTDANGDYYELTLVADAATVDTTPGSWYLDGSNVLWVRTIDSREPDVDIWPLIDNNIHATGDITMYFQDLEVVGSRGGNIWLTNTGAAQTPKAYLKNVELSFGIDTNGLTTTGFSEVYCQNVISHNNDGDGFNHHILNAVVPHAGEIDCVGRNNGKSGDNDNGSSIHDGGSIIRVNGTYNNNIGPNIADIQAAESWCLGTTASDSDSGTTNINFQIDGDMWLDTCTSSLSTYDLWSSQVGDTIYTRNLTSGDNNGGAGTITTY